MAFHRAITSGGKRRLIICLGLIDLGLPAFLKTMRENISSVISGSSSYSSGLMTCASTRLRSEPKVGCKASFFTIVCLSHAEYVTYIATRRVPNNHQSILQHTEAQDPDFAVVLPCVFNLGSHSVKDPRCVLKIKPLVRQCPITLCLILRDTHGIIVYTKKGLGKWDEWRLDAPASALGLTYWRTDWIALKAQKRYAQSTWLQTHR